MKHSGLQRDVLSLYRKCLRVSRTKGEVSEHQLGHGTFLIDKQARIHFEKYARSVCLPLLVIQSFGYRSTLADIVQQ